MIRGILFDLGDTLIDFEPMDTRGAFRAAARQTYGFLKAHIALLPPFEDYCKRQYRAVRWAYLWAKLRRRDFNSLAILRSFCTSIGGNLTEDELHELAWLWYAPLVEFSGVEEGLADTLNVLHRRGYRLGIISNTFVDGAIHDRHLELHGLLDLFPVRVYSSAFNFRKPDPRIFHTALERMGVSPDAAMFVGDLVKTDMVGARRAGMTAVLKEPWGSSHSSRHADFIIQRLSELPRVLAELGEAPAAPTPSMIFAEPMFAE